MPASLPPSLLFTRKRNTPESQIIHFGHGWTSSRIWKCLLACYVDVRQMFRAKRGFLGTASNHDDAGGESDRDSALPGNLRCPGD